MKKPGETLQWKYRDQIMEGKILAVVPPNTDPLSCLPPIELAKYIKPSFSKLRNETSYLVLGQKSTNGKQYYLKWPLNQYLV